MKQSRAVQFSWALGLIVVIMLAMKHMPGGTTPLEVKEVNPGFCLVAIWLF